MATVGFAITKNKVPSLPPPMVLPKPTSLLLTDGVDGQRGCMQATKHLSAELRQAAQAAGIDIHIVDPSEPLEAQDGHPFQAIIHKVRGDTGAHLWQCSAAVCRELPASGSTDLVGPHAHRAQLRIQGSAIVSANALPQALRRRSGSIRPRTATFQSSTTSTPSGR